VAVHLKLSIGKKISSPSMLLRPADNVLKATSCECGMCLRPNLIAMTTAWQHLHENTSNLTLKLHNESYIIFLTLLCNKMIKNKVEIIL